MYRPLQVLSLEFELNVSRSGCNGRVWGVLPLLVYLSLGRNQTVARNLEKTWKWPGIPFQQFCRNPDWTSKTKLNLIIKMNNLFDKNIQDLRTLMRAQNGQYDFFYKRTPGTLLTTMLSWDALFQLGLHVWMFHDCHRTWKKLILVPLKLSSRNHWITEKIHFNYFESVAFTVGSLDATVDVLPIYLACSQLRGFFKRINFLFGSSCTQ